MDKLTWFKFTPSDWMMGKIQRCSEITQARFLRLCCLYWNKDCNISSEDAIIEIDQDHFDTLVSKKIICLDGEFLKISFLDEQYIEIEEANEGKSKSGIIGNLKRWHPAIYNRFNNKEISLEKAIELSKTRPSPPDPIPIAGLSHTDHNPIPTGSQSIAEKKREEERREEEKREEEKREEILLKKETKKVFNFKSELLKYGFEPQLVEDWLKVRKTKKASNTETAFNSFINEMEKKTCDINEMLRIAVEKSWSGFKHSWVENLNIQQNGNKPNHATATTDQLKQSSVDAVTAMFIGK